MDGLDVASAGGSSGRSATEKMLAALSARTFLMNNAHEDGPVLFQTRWALSYLGGPLTGSQITRLMSDSRPAATETESKEPDSNPLPSAASIGSGTRPTVPAAISERFLAVSHPPTGDERIVYRPCLVGAATVHYTNASAKIDEWQDVVLLAPLERPGRTSPWTDATESTAPMSFDDEPEADATFSPLPAVASNVKRYATWEKKLSSHLYRTRRLSVWQCRKPKLVSQVSETQGDFKARLRDALREQRDLDVEKLRRRYAPKLARLGDRIVKAEHRVEVEQSQYSQKKSQAAISLGATVVGALFGRKLGSLGNLGRATTAARGAGRAARERGDIARAKERVKSLRQQLRELEKKFDGDRARLHAEMDVEALHIKALKIACRKTDLEVEPLMLVWTPWRVGQDGIAQPAYDA